MDESSSLKRLREEEKQVVEHEEEINKRQKSYNDIITLLEEEEDEPNQDLSFLISTLQEEISSSGSELACPVSTETDPVCSSSGGEEQVEKVMRHLLEASDDELGIPNTSGADSNKEMDGFDLVVGEQVDDRDLLLAVSDGLLEFEDYEADNYYNSLLQSEIFM